MSQQHTASVVAPDHHVVAQHADRPEQLAHALGQEVEHRRRRGPAPVVTHAVPGTDHHAGYRSQQRLPEAEELVRSGGRRPPAPTGPRPILRVAHQVHRVGLGPGVEPMAGDAGGRAVQGDPRPLHRRGDRHGRPGRRADPEVERHREHEQPGRRPAHPSGKVYDRGEQHHDQAQGARRHSDARQDPHDAWLPDPRW